MAESQRRANEPIDRVLRRFKKKVKDEGIIQEAKKENSMKNHLKARRRETEQR